MAASTQSCLPAAEEDAVIRKRFRTHTVVSSQTEIPMFKKLVKKYEQFCQAVQSGGPEEAARVHNELLADLYAVQAHMERLQAAAAAFRREQQLYVEKQEQLQAAITQAAQDIEDRKVELEQARVELAQQQEYEEAKQQVMRVPARSITRAEMGAVEKEISDLTQQGAALDAVMERRRVQFAAIVHVIEQVHASLAEPEEEGAAGAEGSTPQLMQLG